MRPRRRDLLAELDAWRSRALDAEAAAPDLDAARAEVRALIAVRTREALAVRKRAGARLGRPVALPAWVRARIAAERAAGSTLAAIADGLTADGIPGPQGGARWYRSTVAGALRSLDLDAEAAELAALAVQVPA